MILVQSQLSITHSHWTGAQDFGLNYVTANSREIYREKMTNFEILYKIPKKSQENGTKIV